MMKRGWVLLAAGGALVAGAGGFFLVRAFFSTPGGAPPSCSEAASLARRLNPDLASQARIEAADQIFLRRYQELCFRLCEQRRELAGRLAQATVEDPAARKNIAAIHETMADMEWLTFQHLVTLRNLLPAEARADYVKDIQARWEQGQQHLRCLAQGAACGVPPTGPDAGPPRPGEE